MPRFILFIATFLYLFTGVAQAQTDTTELKTRPKIGLVLGGGGAKGLAHIGVIKMLEENHIPVDVVAGTSMGAIVGSLYASGYSSEQLIEIGNELDWADIFNDKTARSRSTFRRKSDDYGFLTDYKITFKNGQIVLPKGIIQGQNLFLELSRLLSKTRAIGNFDELPIPFRLVATDLSTGRPVVMTDGDLATAVFASMAIPGFIPPVERDGKYLIDGGLVNNVPVNLARQLGADIVIAVNVGTDPKPAEEMGSFIDVLRQTQIILTQDNTNFQLATMGADDVLITPDLKGLGAGSFGDVEVLISYGETSAQGGLPFLKALSLNDAEWAKHVQNRTAKPRQTPVIDEVRIVQNSHLSDEVLRSGIRLKAGDILDTDWLNRDIDRLYGGGVFSRITYQLVEEKDRNVLEISANAKESADGYFKFGVALDSNLENDSSFKLGISYTKPQVNRFGGEWRSELTIGDTLGAVSEFYQPLGARQRFFVEPSVSFSRDKIEFTDSQTGRAGLVKTHLYAGALQGGMLLGRWGEVRAGVVVGRGQLEINDAAQNRTKIKLKDSSYLAEFNVDRLDSLSFPTQGGIFVAQYQIHDEFFGGEYKYKEVDVTGFKAFTAGRHTFGLGTRLTGVSGRDAGVLGEASLGGFLSLSGFSEDELTGRYSGLALGTYYYRLNQQAPIFDAPLFLGASLEAGNVYQDWASVDIDDLIYAGSVYAGLKSPLGPIYVGVGYNDTGSTSLYFSIGTFF